jgi:chemotaxis protein histidine kinase CheA
MGLFLVKTQLESLNANIEVSSELGKGTTFKIIFDSYE